MHRTDTRTAKHVMHNTNHVLCYTSVVYHVQLYKILMHGHVMHKVFCIQAKLLALLMTVETHLLNHEFHNRNIIWHSEISDLTPFILGFLT